MLRQKLLNSLTFLFVSVFLVSLFFVSNDAEAKRMSGGFNMGRQSFNVKQNKKLNDFNHYKNNNFFQKNNKDTISNKNKNPLSRWLGPIAGIAAGIGLAALFSQMGLSGVLAQFFSVLLVLILALFVIGFIIRKLKGPGSLNIDKKLSYPNNYSTFQQEKTDFSRNNFSGLNQDFYENSSKKDENSWFIPKDFDSQKFLAQAKIRFSEIQKLWDLGDIENLSNFLTDEMVIEIQGKINDLKTSTGNSFSKIWSLEAELLGIELLENGYMASVKFYGKMSDDQSLESAVEFEEVWNMIKPNDSGWLLSGIQQQKKFND